jgi:hypothetical protein
MKIHGLLKIIFTAVIILAFTLTVYADGIFQMG